MTLRTGGHKVPGHKVPGHKVTVTRFLVGASFRMSKRLVKTCSTYEKYNTIMRLGVVSEEASAVKKYLRKYAQHTKNTIHNASGGCF